MIRIDLDENGDVDEVISWYGCASVHLEALSPGHWMLIVEANGNGERRAHINISPKRAFVYEAIGCEIKSPQTVNERQS